MPWFSGERFNNLQRAVLLTSFDIIGSIICGGHVIGLIFGQQQLVMVNYECSFNQSETGIGRKIFEWAGNYVYIRAQKRMGPFFSAPWSISTSTKIPNQKPSKKNDISREQHSKQANIRQGKLLKVTQKT